MLLNMSARNQHSSGRERLREIIAERSFKEGEFTLSSGKKSDVFFNLKPTMLDPEGLNLLADQVLEVSEECEASCIGGLVMGAVPVLISVVLKSYETPKPLKGFWIRKEQKTHGMQQLLDGDLKPGSRVIVVDDVTTTGESVLKAIDYVENNNCTVSCVVTVIDRCEGARQRLEARGHDLISIFDRSDFTTKKPYGVS